MHAAAVHRPLHYSCLGMQELASARSALCGGRVGGACCQYTCWWYPPCLPGSGSTWYQLHRHARLHQERIRTSRSTMLQGMCGVDVWFCRNDDDAGPATTHAPLPRWHAGSSCANLGAAANWIVAPAAAAVNLPPAAACQLLRCRRRATPQRVRRRSCRLRAHGMRGLGAWDSATSPRSSCVQFLCTWHRCVPHVCMQFLLSLIVTVRSAIRPCAWDGRALGDTPKLDLHSAS